MKTPALDFNDAYVPVLADNLKLSRSEKGNYVLTIEDFNLLINTNLYRLINLMDGKSSIKDIFLSAKEFSSISKEEFGVQLSRLSQYGVLQGNFDKKKKEKASYLKLSTIFLKGRTFNKTLDIIKPFYTEKYFYPVLIIQFAFCLSVFVFNYSEFTNYASVTNFKSLFALSLIGYFTALIHELGHGLVCREYKITPKGIGFGFYILIPVFFADVSKAWHLDKWKRIRIDLAGIYTEQLVISVIIMLYLFTGSTFLFYAAVLLMLHEVQNLNPFLRYDGYWIVSDYFNIYNLRKESNKRVKQLFHRHIQFTRTDWALLLYSVFSYLIIILFVGYIIFFDVNSIVSFPSEFISFLTEQLSRFNLTEVFEFLGRFIIPIAFYSFLINIIIYLSISWYDRRRR